MVKKVKVGQLKPGMFISDFNCSWLKQPFLTKSVKLTSEEMISKIIDQGIAEVYIDTSKGLDVEESPGEEEIREDVQSEIQKEAETEPDPYKSKALSEELDRAEELRKESAEVVSNIMEDVKLGKQIEPEEVDNVVEELVDSVFRNPFALACMCRIKEADDYLFTRSLSVCVLMTAFCRSMNFDRKRVKDVATGALLQDIGMTKVPSEIRNKPGPLSREEFEIVKQHVMQGCDILSEMEGISPATISVVAEHHERYDGTGYPKGLKGDEISLYGQVAGIVDVYDAITSDRCYRNGVEPTKALGKLFDWGQTQFNYELIQKFIRCIGVYPVGTLVRLESGLLGVVVDMGSRGLLYPIVRVVYETNVREFVHPHDIDLSKPVSQGSKNGILCHESASNWKIETTKYLNEH